MLDHYTPAAILSTIQPNYRLLTTPEQLPDPALQAQAYYELVRLAQVRINFITVLHDLVTILLRSCYDLGAVKPCRALDKILICHILFVSVFRVLRKEMA